MSRILIFAPCRIFDEKKRAVGPGIRAWGIATTLAKNGHNCTIVEPVSHKGGAVLDGVRFVGNNSRIEKDGYDVCAVIRNPFLTDSAPKGIPLICDLYDPLLVDEIYMLSHKGAVNLSKAYDYASTLMAVSSALRKADLLICGCEAQKYYYIGMLNLLGRINHHNVDNLDEIIRVVYTGAPPGTPKKSKAMVKGRLFSAADPVILWSSGIYPWFDVETMLEAFKIILKDIPAAKLVFMGAKNPNFEYYSDLGGSVLDKAGLGGLVNKSIFLLDWVPYQEREDVYLESDVAVCTYHRPLETALSIRTRLIDLVWGGLPVITTIGDVVGEHIEKYGAGRVIPTKTPELLASVLKEILKDPGLRKTMAANARRLSDEVFSWDKVIGPYEDFCKNPYFAKDKRDKLVSRAYFAPLKITNLRNMINRTHTSFDIRLNRIINRFSKRQQ